MLTTPTVIIVLVTIIISNHIVVGQLRYLYYATNVVRVASTEGAVNNGTLKKYDLALNKQAPDILFDQEGVTSVVVRDPYIYYTTGYPIKIKRTNLTGDELVTLIDLTPQMRYWDPVVQLHIFNDKLFWQDDNACRGQGTCIRRCTLDGDNCIFPQTVGVASVNFLAGFSVLNESCVIALGYNSNAYIFTPDGTRELKFPTNSSLAFISAVFPSNTINTDNNNINNNDNNNDNNIITDNNSIYFLGSNGWYMSDTNLQKVVLFKQCSIVCDSGNYGLADISRGVFYYKSFSKTYNMVDLSGRNSQILFETPPMVTAKPPYPFGLYLSSK